MLAARSRGLGTCWTTFHLAHEREAAELLGIPYDDVMQAALIPVAYTIGTDFKPAAASRSTRWCTGTAGRLQGSAVSGRTSRRRRGPRRRAGPAAQAAVRGDEPVGPSLPGELLGVAGDPVVGALLRRADHLHRRVPPRRAGRRRRRPGHASRSPRPSGGRGRRAPRGRCSATASGGRSRRRRGLRAPRRDAELEHVRPVVVAGGVEALPLLVEPRGVEVGVEDPSSS